MNPKTIFAIVVILLTAFACNGQDKSIQMKLDSVVWVKKVGTIMYGSSMNGERVTYIYSPKKRTSKKALRWFEIGAFYTIRESLGALRGIYKPAIIRKNI